MKEAVCQVCIHGCRLKPGQWGMCGARKNENGKIVCGNYGQITSLALDPIEKKASENVPSGFHDSFGGQLWL